jgi:hypothetical protein
VVTFVEPQHVTAGDGTITTGRDAITASRELVEPSSADAAAS